MNNAMIIGIAGMIFIWITIQVLPMPSEDSWVVHAILAVAFFLNLAVVLWHGGVRVWGALQ